MCTSAVVKIGY